MAGPETLAIKGLRGHARGFAGVEPEEVRGGPSRGPVGLRAEPSPRAAHS